MLLERLRAETRDEHLALEADLDLVSEALSLDAYRHVLRRFHGFHAAVEAAPAWADAARRAGLDPDASRRLPLLAADLRSLGDARPETLPCCAAPPPLATTAEGAGCLYVLEGACLGGQVIGRHVERRLGLTPRHGAAYFHGHGAATGSRWQALRTGLAAWSREAGADDAVVASAVATFRAMRRWCAADAPARVAG